MTQEEVCYRLNDDLPLCHDDEVNLRNDESSTSQTRPIVRNMVLRFERSAHCLDPDKTDYSTHRKNSLIIQSPTYIPLHAQLTSPSSSHERNSCVSVNSILSNVSELSFESSSSGFGSDRKSGTDYYPIPHRPAPPPPEPFGDSSPSIRKKSLYGELSSSPSKRYSSTPPRCTSPVFPKRVRQPPVIRRKSFAGHQILLNETLWSYGVTQSDLENVGIKFRNQENLDNTEDNNKLTSSNQSEGEEDGNTSDTSSECDRISNVDDVKADEETSTDHSADTLVNEDQRSGSDEEDNFTVASDVSGEQSNYDNVSIKSISSFDMVPYQKYDSITVSSDEYGSEVCHTRDTEFLTVSALGEWCISKSSAAVLIPETKKEKYRRRLTERVNELLHTESVYVEKLRHVVQDYMSQLMNPDVPQVLREFKLDIFCNIELIHRFHSEEFLPALRHCEKDLRKLGQCFRKYEQKFNMYVLYSRNNKRATKLVYHNKKFFQEIQIELGDRLDLSSYLLEPVQRIPRYKLFLDDLVKTYTNYESERAESDSRISKLSADSDETGGSNGEPENEETPLESLKLAKMMIETVLTTVDDIIALENIRESPIKLYEQGRLLRQNEFHVTDNARRRHVMRVFLFEKVILLAAIYRKQLTVELLIYRDHIPVDDLGITAKPQDQHKFTIWYKKRNLKSYKLETREPCVRQAWVTNISDLLWKQAMQKKEMLMKYRKSISSQTSIKSDDSNDVNRFDEKYNSLRGVPGEVRRSPEKKSKRTTWYCE